MVELIIKIGGNMMKDMKEVYYDPSKAQPGTTTLYLKSTGELCELFSPKKLELLCHILSLEPGKETVCEIAKSLGRKQEAISRDANVLAAHEMLQKNREKRKVFLKVPFDSIKIEFVRK